MGQRRYNKDPTTKPGTLNTYTRCLAQLRLPFVLFLGWVGVQRLIIYSISIILAVSIFKKEVTRTTFKKVFPHSIKLRINLAFCIVCIYVCIYVCDMYVCIIELASPSPKLPPSPQVLPQPSIISSKSQLVSMVLGLTLK